MPSLTIRHVTTYRYRQPAPDTNLHGAMNQVPVMLTMATTAA